MAKFNAPSVKKKAVSKKTSKKDSDLISSDHLEDQQEVVVVHGRIGTGKTIFAATVSRFAPKTKLVAKKGRKSLISLDDVFWFQIDRKALAGLKSLGMKVPQVFDLYRYMKKENVDVLAAMDHGLDLAAESDADWLVVDTVSTLDTRMLAANKRATVNHPNAYEAYKRNLDQHADLVDGIIELGKNVIFLTHSRAFSEEKDQQNKAYAITIAGGGTMLPDLTGQAPKYYKRDNSLQIVMHAFKDPKTRKIVRKALIGINNEGEGKNRYEGILPEEQEPPHLRKLLEMAWEV